MINTLHPAKEKKRRSLFSHRTLHTTKDIETPKLIGDEKILQINNLQLGVFSYDDKKTMMSTFTDNTTSQYISFIYIIRSCACVCCIKTLMLKIELSKILIEIHLMRIMRKLSCILIRCHDSILCLPKPEANMPYPQDSKLVDKNIMSLKIKQILI